MLQEFRVHNFKSLINVVFQPQNTNLLLGINNSGKTNLCQALQFVAASSQHSLSLCADSVGGRFGMTNFALNESMVEFYVKADVPFEKESLTFEYRFVISPPRHGAADTEVRLHREALRVTGGGFDKTALFDNKSGRVQVLNEKEYLEGKKSYDETTAPTETTILQRLYDPNTNSRSNCFRQYLNAWIYYDLSPMAMRGYTHKPGEYIVAQNGGNLASVLYALKTSNERDYRELLKIVQKIEPRLDLINFFGGSDNNVFMVFEDSDRNALPAGNASSGTLRFLALAYILLIQPRGILSPLCIIEEPENGLYVNFLKAMFEMVESATTRSQLIFTSHAPYFIDLFDECVNGIFVLNRRKEHTEILQPDVEEVKRRLEDYPLGEQHFREMLG